MEKHVLRIFGALCFLAILATGQAITCYVCNSYFESGCHDLGTGNSSGFLRDCDKEPIFSNHTEVPKKYEFCRKMTVSLSGEDRPRVVRTCSWIKHKNNCYHTTTLDVKSTVCQCFETGCNDSASLKYSWIPLVISFAVWLSQSR